VLETVSDLKEEDNSDNAAAEMNNLNLHDDPAAFRSED